MRSVPFTLSGVLGQVDVARAVRRLPPPNNDPKGPCI